MYAKQTKEDRRYDKQLKSQDRSIRTLKLKGILELVVQRYSEEEIERALDQLEKEGIKFYHEKNL